MMPLARSVALLGALACSACAARPADPVPAPASTSRDNDGAASVLADAGFEGDVLVLRDASRVDVVQEVDTGRLWPWASVTKQVVSVLVMQQVEAGTLQLDDSAAEHVDGLKQGPDAPTVRQLLQHRSGLRNPDETPPDAQGVPSFYTDGPTGLQWCLDERVQPPDEGWAYNNCDYIVLGEVLERATGRDLATLLAEAVEAPAGLESTWLVGASPARATLPADAERLARYGASGGLVGPLRDMLRFDAALMDGRLLGDDARATLWLGEPALGFMALGQWSFEAALAGCDDPVRIVERRGAVDRYQTRNFILPGRHLAIALATEQPGFEFGEIWMGSGFSHALLSAVVCGD